MPAVTVKEIPGVCRAEIHHCERIFEDLNASEQVVKVICFHPHYRFTPHDFQSRAELDQQLAEHPPDAWGNLLMVPPEQHDYVISLRVAPAGDAGELREREENVGVALIPQGRLEAEGLNQESAWPIIEQLVRHWQAYCNGAVYWMLVNALPPLTNEDLFDDGWQFASGDLYELDDAALDDVLVDALLGGPAVDVEQAPWQPRVPTLW